MRACYIIRGNHKTHRGFNKAVAMDQSQKTDSTKGRGNNVQTQISKDIRGAPVGSAGCGSSGKLLVSFLPPKPTCSLRRFSIGVCGIQRPIPPTGPPF